MSKTIIINTVDDKAHAHREIDAISSSGKIAVVFMSAKSLRSLKQNNWLWGCARQMAAWLVVDGEKFDEEEWYRAIEKKWSIPETKRDPLTGEVYFSYTPLKEKGTKEFSKIMMELQAFVAEYGITLIHPDDRGR